MKRDDVDLAAGASLRRLPLWLSPGSGSLFGWYHDAPGAPAGDAVAVICGPVGYEYTRAHRSIRHLADRLAHAGVPALRFDWHGIGDSAGSDLDPARMDTWRANVLEAVARARELSGRARVCLVGIRLGASLAALASAEAAIDSLVLWNPVVKGRAYVRELQAIASAAATPMPEDGSLESAGFVMTAETVGSLKSLDLFRHPVRARRVLLAWRDDLSPDDAYGQHVAAMGLEVTEARLPGWAGMMAEHQFTVVPDAALATVVQFAAAASGSVSSSRREMESDPGAEIEVDPGVLERPCRLGPEEALFGMLARPDRDPQRTAVLLFNAGSVHHVGPNRISVTIARRLARMGFAVLRFDLAGIGDSILRGGGRENHPYPAHATADVREAIDWLGREHGYARFVAMGLCSGAHTAFHAGLELADADIRELVLINPLTFRYVEGMSLETVARAMDVQQYRKSARDPKRWLKLLRGEVNFRRLAEVAIAHPLDVAKSKYAALCERFHPRRAPLLARQLRQLDGMKRPVTLLIAEGDPGRDILMSGAKVTATRGIRSGAIRLETIAGGDHTFSQSGPREALLGKLEAHLARHLRHAGSAS